MPTIVNKNYEMNKRFSNSTKSSITWVCIMEMVNNNNCNNSIVNNLHSKCQDIYQEFISISSYIQQQLKNIQIGRVINKYW